MTEAEQNVGRLLASMTPDEWRQRLEWIRRNQPKNYRMIVDFVRERRQEEEFANRTLETLRGVFSTGG